MNKTQYLDLSYLKAVFFDLDDVLVFSEDAHNKAWELSLPQFGGRPDEIDFRALTGVCDIQQAQRFKTQFNLKEDVGSLFEAKRQIFMELAKSGLSAPDGRNALLEKLSVSYTIGVVSSSRSDVVEHILASEKIRSFFHFVIGYEDCLRHKPDPFPYEYALTKAGVKPHEALVIEDSFSGITAAQKASIPVVGIFKNQRVDQIISGVKYFNDFSAVHTDLFQTLGYA